MTHTLEIIVLILVVVLGAVFVPVFGVFVDPSPDGTDGGSNPPTGPTENATFTLFQTENTWHNFSPYQFHVFINFTMSGFVSTMSWYICHPRRTPASCHPFSSSGNDKTRTWPDGTVTNFDPLDIADSGAEYQLFINPVNDTQTGENGNGKSQPSPNQRLWFICLLGTVILVLIALIVFGFDT